MSTKQLLDTDMKTLARTAGAGFDWWMGELTDLVPRRLRRGRRGGQMLMFDGQALSPAPRPGRSAILVLSPSMCLVRRLERPLMSERDLARLVEMDRDRIMPLSGARMLVATRIVSRDPARRRMLIEVAGLEQETVKRLADALLASDIAPAHILLPREGDATIDMLPAFRAAGLVVERGLTATYWRILLVALLLLNGGLAVWRDQASVERLEARVAAQRSGVLVAQRLRQQLVNNDVLMRGSVARRRDHDALAVVASVTEAVPAGTIIQRLAWEGETLRLTGYARDVGGLVQALGRQPLFADIERNVPDATIALPIGEPFEIRARVRRPQ